MTTRSFLRCLAFSALALALLAPAASSYARSKPDPDKQARKVQKKLSHFKKGALVHVVFSNGSESTGGLGDLGERDFKLTNVETNTVETHGYLEVDSVSKGSESIGKGSTPHHHRGPF